MVSLDLVRQGYFLLMYPELEYESGDAHSCVPASASRNSPWSLMVLVASFLFLYLVQWRHYQYFGLSCIEVCRDIQ
jgi:hypothetical protein